MILAVTAFFAVGLASVQIRTIFSDLFPSNHPFVQTFKDHPNFGNPLTITLMVKRKDGDIYNLETLEKVYRMTRDIDLAPSVDHDQVLSIATEKARYAEATPYGVDVKPLMDGSAPKDEAELEEFKHRVDRANNVRTFLISQDETATLITATFIERTLDYGETFKHVQDMVERERDEHHEIYAAGQPMLTGWVYTYQKQMIGIFGITAAALVFSLIFYMRNVPGIVAPITVSVVSAIWGFGLTGWLKHPIEPLIMVVPMLLVARAFSHCVQFLERFYELLYEVKDKDTAATLALSVMMAPGILGIVTDAAGLFLIAVAPIPVMERFAIFCGFWALILIPTDVFLAAILAAMLPTPRNVEKLIGKSSEKSWHDSLIGMLGVIGRLSHGSRAKVTGLAVVLLTVFSFMQLLKLEIGNPVEGSNLLFDDSEFNTAVRAVNSHFPGLMTLEIVLEGRGVQTTKAVERLAKSGMSEATPAQWLKAITEAGIPETEIKWLSGQEFLKGKEPMSSEAVMDQVGQAGPRSLREAETIAVSFDIQRALEAYDNPPEATLSFADYLPEANRLFGGGNPKWASIDPSDESVNGTVTALLLGSNAKNYGHVSDFTMQNGTISLWYKNNKQETVDIALEQTREVLEKVGVERGNFNVRLGTGAIALQQSVNDTVDYYQYVILIALNVIILVVAAIAYRSMTAGWILLIPVNLSNILLGAVMVQMGLGLDVNSLPIASIGIGVGIDYGIYLLSRICEEFAETKDWGNAIQRSVQTSGKAIFFTATIVMISILPWYFLSDLKFLADMGLLLVMVMTINMLIALVVLPLLVYWWKPKFVEREDQLFSEKIDLTALAKHA
jgi:predicted RND superfamily exporter protein